MPRQPFAKLRLTALAVVAAVALIAPPAQADEAKTSFNIPAQDLSTALREFARQSSREILFSSEVAQGKKSKGVKGDLTADAALTKLLAGTGLVVAKSANGTTLVTTPDAKEASGKSGPPIAPSGATTVQALSSTTSEGQKTASLEEVLVTGSRLPSARLQAASEVKIYRREDLQISGQSDIASFLNILPTASNAVTESGTQTSYGQTTVQLHGLPLGTTLVLLNGRRLETSGLSAAPGQRNFFDLNQIPLGALDRIEVLSEGSSAIYGSDAIAGVVNLILRRDIEGLEINTRFGSANGTQDYSGSLATGKAWDNGGISLIGSYLHQTPLTGIQRSITRDQDYRSFGGIDARSTSCENANFFSTTGAPLPGAPSGETFAAVTPSSSGALTLRYGQLNFCGTDRGLIPESKRYGLLAQGHQQLTSDIEIFADALLTHTEQSPVKGGQPLYGTTDSQDYTLPASNPFNPFGTDVGIAFLFNPGALPPPRLDTQSTFFNFAAGLRGQAGKDLHWEAYSWYSQDKTRSQVNASFNDAQAALNLTDPATAFNPFQPYPLSDAFKQALSYLLADNEYRGGTIGASGFVRSKLFKLPAGDVEALAGLEYIRDSIGYNFISGYFRHIPTRPPQDDFNRNTASAFFEFRVPLLGSGTQSNLLAATTAGRYDDYFGFGKKFTPQFGLELRPAADLLLRATYADSFKAPSLFQLNSPQSSFRPIVTDPILGTRYQVNAIQGGNPNLSPESGRSASLGAVFTSSALPGLRLSATAWDIDLRDNVQSLSAQVIVANEALLPNLVTRGNGPAGPRSITLVNASFTNFGQIKVQGVDLNASLSKPTAVGVFTPSLSVAIIDSYKTKLVPGQAEQDRAGKASSDLNWAPKLKATAALNWSRGPVKVNLAGRYVGHYFDYESLTREIGNFGFVDANLHYSFNDVGRSPLIRGAYLEAGGVNLLNRQPQYSSYFFGALGYDPAQSDIHGRYLYVGLGANF